MRTNSRLLFRFFIFVASSATIFFYADSGLAAEKVNLPVPFTSEAPGGNWTGSWFNGCEEASVLMIEKYYLKQPLSRATAIKTMSDLFKWQDKNFGYNYDTDSKEIAEMIEAKFSYRAKIVTNPSLAAIKAELKVRRPVIALLNGYKIYGRLYGTGYHMFVLKGYDDTTKQFIVNDSGSSKRGAGARYGYAKILNNLSDFSRKANKPSGLPTVIFTYFPASSSSFSAEGA